MSKRRTLVAIPPIPTVVAPDPYMKKDMLHAIENYCPHCGSSEYIDVNAVDGEWGEGRPASDWYVVESLHCNKCGKDFEQDYGMTFEGQKLPSAGSRTIPLPDGVTEKAELLARDLDTFIELLDELADPEPQADDCLEYASVLQAHKALADDPKLKRVRQRLLDLKPYLD